MFVKQHRIERTRSAVRIQHRPEVAADSFNRQPQHRCTLVNRVKEPRLDVNHRHRISHACQRNAGITPAGPELQDASTGRQVHGLDDESNGHQRVADGLCAMRIVGERLPGGVGQVLQPQRALVLRVIVFHGGDSQIKFTLLARVFVAVRVKGGSLVATEFERSQHLPQVIVGTSRRFTRETQALVEFLQGGEDSYSRGRTAGRVLLVRWLSLPIGRRRHKNRTTTARKHCGRPAATGPEQLSIHGRYRAPAGKETASGKEAS